MRRAAALLLAGMLVSCGGGESGGGESGGGGNVGGGNVGGGETTPPTVGITSPAAGITVSDSVTLTAIASDNVGVVGVQFQLDGANVGTEYTAEPYSATWDTTTGRNGSHTLTAVARDAAGNRTTSVPVTVSVVNDAPPPTPGRSEETDASVNLSSGWTQSPPDWFAWSGGSAVQSAVPLATATYTFTGTSVAWIGHRSGSSGIALVKVDNGTAVPVNLFARTVEVNSPVFSVSGLSPGSHTLTIQVSGTKDAESQGTAIVVDAFAAPAPVVSHLQETDPDVVFTGAWAQADDRFGWSGGGVATVPDPPVGGARVSGTLGAKATLAFRGTAISWSGARMPSTGIARVSLDGVVSEVDTYSPTIKLQDIVFTATGLADASHTLTIEATGRKNDFSTDAQIVVDAFDVTTPGRRFQERDAAVTYTGAWIHGNLNRTWSEGTISESNTPGAKVTFTFTGTSVSWIGCRKLSTGLARVTLDAGPPVEIETYLPPPIEAYQTTLFRADGLAPGTHTLTIEAVSSNGSYLVVDAFDVRP